MGATGVNETPVVFNPTGLTSGTAPTPVTKILSLSGKVAMGKVKYTS